MTIGNLPTLGALVATLAYLVAAIVARQAARRQRRERRAGWRLLALVLAVLAVLRLFNVEEHLARVVAKVAWQAGLYAGRAPFQRVAVGVALAIGLLGAGAAGVAARRSGAALAIGLVATTLLAILAALNTISLHATDHLLLAGWGPVTLSRLIEAGALAILLVAAGTTARAPR